MRANTRLFSSIRFAPTLRRARGFTFVELCLSLMVSAMIASALAAFTLAMANCWKQAGAVQSEAILVNQLTERLQSHLQSAAAVGAWRDGNTANKPAGVLIWTSDINGDGLMQSSELAAIMHSPSSKALEFYQMTNVGADATWTSGEFNASTAIDQFVVGLSGSPILRNINSATLNVAKPSSGVSPMVTWTVALPQSDGSSVTETVRTALRSPTP